MLIIINGPNLNLLGLREPHIYGHLKFDDYLKAIREKYPDIEIDYFQSNHEGEIIDKIHDIYVNRKDCQGIILNPGAFAHYSYAIADAIRSVDLPVIEVHISNIHAREKFRHNSVTAEASNAMICGCGLKGYELALIYLLDN